MKVNSEQKQIELRDIYEILLDIRDALKESSKWSKFSGIKEVKPILELHLPEYAEKLMYHLSDGSKGTQEIAKIVGNTSYSTVFRYWKEWEKSGLGESVTIPGGSRFKRSFDLEDFGIKIQIPKQNNSQETRQAETPSSTQVGAETHDQ